MLVQRVSVAVDRGFEVEDELLEPKPRRICGSKQTHNGAPAFDRVRLPTSGW